jgi:spore coat protein U-like protein
MASGGAFLLYQLTPTPAHTTVRGDGTGGTSTPRPLPVLPQDTYRLRPDPGPQAARPGTYSDTILVTVIF